MHNDFWHCDYHFLRWMTLTWSGILIRNFPCNYWELSSQYPTISLKLAIERNTTRQILPHGNVSESTKHDIIHYAGSEALCWRLHPLPPAAHQHNTLTYTQERWNTHHYILMKTQKKATEVHTTYTQSCIFNSFVSLRVTHSLLLIVLFGHLTLWQLQRHSALTK